MAILKRDDSGTPIQVYGQYGPHVTFGIGTAARVKLEEDAIYEFSADGGYVFALGTTTVVATATNGRYGGLDPHLEHIPQGATNRSYLSVLGSPVGLWTSGEYFTYVKVG